MKISRDLIVINCMIFLSTGITVVCGLYNIIKLQYSGNLYFLFRFSDYEGVYNILNYLFILLVFILSIGIFSFKDKFRRLMLLVLFCIIIFNSFDYIFKNLLSIKKAESVLLYLSDLLFLLSLIFYFSTKRIKNQFRNKGAATFNI